MQLLSEPLQSFGDDDNHGNGNDGGDNEEDEDGTRTGIPIEEPHGYNNMSSLPNYWMNRVVRSCLEL